MSKKSNKKKREAARSAQFNANTPMDCCKKPWNESHTRQDCDKCFNKMSSIMNSTPIIKPIAEHIKSKAE